MTIVREAIANVRARLTAHHAHHNGRTVAFRMNDSGTFDLNFDDGENYRNLADLTAEELAETYLGITPPTPAKRRSIPLGQGWSVSLRRDEVVPEDPGAGCPAVVHGPFGKSATYGFALDQGVVHDRDHSEVEIPSAVYRKLDRAEGEVDTYLHDVTRWLARQKG